LNALPTAALQKNLRLRANIVQAIRRFFLNSDYLEVETPVRIPAPAPELHIQAPPSGDWFLRTSPELCMKRLLSYGFPRIFQICRCFRQGERGSRHLPEMTLLEWYFAGGNYLDMMDACESLIRFVAAEVCGNDTLLYQGQKIDLGPSWTRMTVSEAFYRYASISMERALDLDRFDEVMGCDIEPFLGFGTPLFLYDYPASCGALARLKPDNPRVAQRFELYMGGLELCNAFSELTDAGEQRRRFEKERYLRSVAGGCEYPIPEKFLSDMEKMPESAGNALGIDRLVMIFADTPSIDDTVAFTPEML
jgi:elongation factor P--(R)-beta-lysine ligase